MYNNTEEIEPHSASPATDLFLEKDEAIVSWKKYFVTTFLLSASYILLSFFLIGFKTDQVFLALLFSSLYLVTKTTRRFITGFSIFFVHWIIFDYMKALPNYMVSPVNIESLYGLEKQIFGININGIILTPNEYWLQNPVTFLDVISGLFYLSWVPVPMMFAGFMFYRNRKQFFYFSLTFLFVNILGYVVYYFYPAAPPWYVQNFGFEFNAATPGNTAGLARFDNFFGIQLFESMYAKSSNVFAAMPSLHSAYPVIVVYYAFKNKLNFIAKSFFVLVMLGIWFGAVYTSHHYVLDVLAGLLCAIIAIYLFRFLAEKNTYVKQFINSFIRATEK